ncbi:Enoyl-CoA hydratase/carnithine racemase [Mesorhizobium albiziae]|uniref:Enoyl-CoA hydratase/carnithine racemase n=1 Tax=Neomesorhizobium albiziae TaxID=335020 RepID=A0A1I4EKK4_9HYPH|nr:enoyl-CoA hydratase [Mesorhizobium albiziae]GLS34377.1 enoyl-CoA hydratase [Mesorhizobium albiziae]SFL05819.1 Enoyl-CoA hydratase/carnithine racemase [Mesorhizobium albiziae]
MNDIITERSGGILRIEFNRPEKKNAMTKAMYTRLAEIFNEAADDEETDVVLWHSAGDAFCAGNDAADFLKPPPASGKPPQAQLMEAFIKFEKPIVVAVQGAAIGGGTTMLTHCDVVYAGQGARFQLPFINLALTPEFGSSYSLPARIGHIRAAELFLLGEPFGAARAAELGLVTRVVPDDRLFATAMETAKKLAAKPSGALWASKRLLKLGFIDQVKAAIEKEGQEFSQRLRSADAKEALSAFIEKRPPNFTKGAASVAAE